VLGAGWFALGGGEFLFRKWVVVLSGVGPLIEIKAIEKADQRAAE